MTTFVYSLPVVNGSEDTWGTTINTNWTNIGTFLGSLDSAELAKLDGLTASTAELNYSVGVTSAIQTQLNATSAISISAGGGLSGGGNLTANRTISHSDTSSQGSVNNSGNTVIQDISVDTYGHVTSIGSKALSIPAAYTQPTATGATGTYAFLRADTDSSSISAGSTVSGSTMRYSNANFDKSGTPSGTWRCMGYSPNRSFPTTYLRIS